MIEVRAGKKARCLLLVLKKMVKEDVVEVSAKEIVCDWNSVDAWLQNAVC